MEIIAVAALKEVAPASAALREGVGALGVRNPTAHTETSSASLRPTYSEPLQRSSRGLANAAGGTAGGKHVIGFFVLFQIE